MIKAKIGLPRSLFYYYHGAMWKYFFEVLGHEVLISPKTNPEIMELGTNLATDEMCLSFKNFLGHVKYLEGKCDCILVPRIDNYGSSNQTCTNFLAAYDIVSNFIETPILNYNIAYTEQEDEAFAFSMLGSIFYHSKKEIAEAYQKAKAMDRLLKLRNQQENEKRLRKNGYKVLLVGHPYNLYDAMIGEPLVHLIRQNGAEVLYSDAFPEQLTASLSKKYSSTLYFKYNKQAIGSIALLEDQIDGIIFLTTFPCGPDSLVNELVMRKVNLPYLNLIIDDVSSMAGFETRLESFFDLLEERRLRHG